MLIVLEKNRAAIENWRRMTYLSFQESHAE